MSNAGGVLLAVILVALLVSIGLPLIYSWRVLRLDEPSLATWALVAVDAALVLALMLVVARWDIAGFYTRLGVIGLFGIALLWSLARHIRRPWHVPGTLRPRWTIAVSLVLLAAALGYVVSGMLPPVDVRQLAFPLKDGRFVVGQGGGIVILNHHASHPEQRYAADIGAIGSHGFRADGVLPEDLESYAVYGAEIVSPCLGTVLSARDGLPDLVPPAADPENAAGNHVIIDCGGFNVELAHFQRGSITVADGDRLDVGDALGRVGNSGNTTEPHLHIHAVDPQTEKGIPVAFDGRPPVRNAIFVN
jgi:hypothetical protein